MSFVGILILGSCLSLFLGSAAVTEKDQFALVFAGGGLRFAGALSLVLFVSFYMRRAFEAQEVEFLLSRPIGRVAFLTSHVLSFSFLAFLMGLMEGAALYILSPSLFGNGSLLWTASIIAENIIMVSAALFFSMVVSSATVSAMVSVAFYILARMMGQILGTIDSGNKIFDTQILEWIMQAISMVMPRLDLMGQTSWLIYSPDSSISYGFIILQGAVFTAVLFMASAIDFLRKQF